MLLVGKKCTLCPQTILELLAVLHEEFKQTFIWYQKYVRKVSYTLPLSRKILLNLCLLSCKQETAAKRYIELNKNSSHSNTVQCFFPWLVHLSFCKYINFEQFWILLLIRPGMATKSWWSHASILLWTRCTSSLIYLVHSRFGLQSTIYSIYGTEDNL